MKDNELLKRYDPEIYEAVSKETARQRNKIELIASENFVSEVVMEANGTTLPISMPRDIPESATTADASMSTRLSSSPSSVSEKVT